MPYLRALAIGLVLAGIGWWLAREVVAPRSEPGLRRATHAAWHTSFSFGAPASSFASSDAGLASLAGDGSVEPPATGVLSRAITPLLCPESARRICAARRAVDCPDAARIEGEPCEAWFESVCASWVERNYGASDDRFQLDERALERCLDPLRHDAGTGESVTMAAACGELARDPALEGSPCAFSWYACGRDGRCIDGRCRANARLGETCADRECGAGLSCVMGTCERLVAHGARCEVGAPCDDPADACIHDVCASHFVDGDACDFDDACAASSRCIGGHCTHVERTSCTLEADCGHGRTCAGESEARCEAVVGRGAPCLGDADCGVLDCIRGRCTGDTELTPGVLPAGADCLYATNDQCRAGLVCASELDGYRCRRPRALGERCDEDAACSPDAMCIWRVPAGRCEAALCGVRDYFLDAGEE